MKINFNNKMVQFVSVASFFVVSMTVMWFMGGASSKTVEAKSVYIPKAPVAQANYDKLLLNLCESGLKPLASAKIDDFRADGGNSNVADLNDLASKEKRDCSKATVEWRFQ